MSLVDRLRADKCMVGDGTGVSYYDTRPLSAEAADEIVRLHRQVTAHKLEIARLREMIKIEDFEGLR
jgi:hypothetical protein